MGEMLIDSIFGVLTGLGRLLNLVWKGAANLKVHLIVQNFCMHFNFEFWRKNSKLRCMQNLKNKLYLEMTIPFNHRRQYFLPNNLNGTEV